MKLAQLWQTTAFRQAALYSAFLIAAVALALGSVYVATVGAIERQTAATIAAEVQGLSEQFRAGGLTRLARTIERRSRAAGGASSIYMLVDADLRSVAGNLDRWPDAAPENGSFAFRLLVTEGQGSRRAVAESFRLPGGYRLLVGRDAEDLELVRGRFRAAILWVGGGALLFGLGAGLLLARRVLARVARAAQAGERIAAGQLERRLPTGGSGDEFDRLAESVNGMMDRIEGLMRAMRIATDSISHDLRRPLTRLRARLELAEGDPETVGAAVEEVDRTVKILDNLIRIARAEAGDQTVAFVPTDIAALVEDAADLYRPLAEAEGLSFEVVTEAMVRPVERQLLAQAVANLIDNAIKYAPPDVGRIRVTLRARPDGRAEIAVTDNGSGIPEADRERATARFVRLEPSRGGEGAGLGLSLAAAVMRLHKGDLILGDAGPGLVARLLF